MVNSATLGTEQPREVQPESTGPAPAPTAPRPGAPAARKLWKVALVLIGACGIAVAVGFTILAGEVRTEDAQVDAHITTLSPRISGYVSALHVNDNQGVKAGQLLVEIDPRDYQAAVGQARGAYDATLAQARSAKVDIRLTRDTTASAVQGSLAAKAASQAELLRSKESLEEAATAALSAAQANVAARQATNTRAQADLRRYRPLVKTGDVSALQFDTVEASARVAQSELDLAQQQLAEARKTVDIAKAQTAAAQAQLQHSEAQLKQSQALEEQVPVREAQYESAQAAVERAKAQLEEAELRLSYTEIRAPIAGEVTQRTVQLGDYVSPGQLLLTIVPLDQIYVVANFKETQLARVRPGQRVVIRADVYGSRQFEGVVDSIAGATGSREALLPPQNATGNFVKVVQRVPVKILVKRPSDPRFVLRPGMNVEATIDVR